MCSYGSFPHGCTVLHCANRSGFMWSTIDGNLDNLRSGATTDSTVMNTLTQICKYMHTFQLKIYAAVNYWLINIKFQKKIAMS